MIMRFTLPATAALLIVLGCAGADRPDADSTAPASQSAAAASTPASSADRARAAARVANAIAANPAAADSILRANNHTRESFEKAIWEIAADSAMSAVYAAARVP